MYECGVDFLISLFMQMLITWYALVDKYFIE